MPQSPNLRRKVPRQADRKAPRAKSAWDLAFDGFVASRVAINASSATLDLYRWILQGKRLTTFRSDHGIDAPSGFTPAMIATLQGELLSDAVGLSGNTVVSMTRVLRTFMSWCALDGRWGVEAASGKVPFPKVDETRKEVLRKGEEDLLIKACTNDRDRFIVKFLLHTGLRLGELSRLTVDDFDIDYTRVFVRTSKTRRTRTVPLNSKVHRLDRDVRQYITHTRPRKTQCPQLLLTTKKFGDDYRPLTPHSIQTMLRRLGDTAGIDANPHKFRHTFATRRSKEVDLLLLQRVLGHQSANMTERYYNPDDDDIVAGWLEGSTRR